MTPDEMRLAYTARVVRRIEARREEVEAERVDRRFRGLGVNVSAVNGACDLRIWYDVRWAGRDEARTPDGGTLRMFERGQIEEARVIDDLRSIGMEVDPVDPETGEQWRILGIDGWVRGYADGIVSKGVPGHTRTRHVLEIKTVNDRKFGQLQVKGLREANQWHWGQVQIGGYLLGCKRGLYYAVNRNTEAVYVENVRIEEADALRMIGRVERLIAAPSPPPQLPENRRAICNHCDYKSFCRDGGTISRNCRTCLHGQLIAGARFRCGLHDMVPSPEIETSGCDEYIPADWVGDPDHRRRTDPW